MTHYGNSPLADTQHTKAQCDDIVMEIACGLYDFRTTLRLNTLE